MSAEDLLAPPSAEELDAILRSSGTAAPPAPSLVNRRSCAFEPRWQRYVVRGRQYGQQFSHLYSRRFAQMRPMVWAAAKARWAKELAGGVQHVERLVQLKEGARSVCVGVLYKQMKLRYSVIDEYQRELGISGSVYPLEDYTSAEDTLEIEDDSGRMRLTGNLGALPVHSLSTGLALAVRGTMGSDGEFVVEDWCAPGLPPPLPEAVRTLRPGGDAGPFVLLASGLSFGGDADPLPATLLVDFVAGRLGSRADRTSVAANICRVILAGNSMAPLNDGARLREKNLPLADQERIAGPLYELDTMLAQLASAVPVDIMPGADDASSIALPQQPFHRSLLPTACRYTSLTRPPNPYEALIGERLVMGSSGQPLTDMLKFTRSGAAAPATEGASGGAGAGTGSGDATEGDAMDVEAAPGDAVGPRPADIALDMMEKMLTWRHLAPTAPDTLPCYPFYEEDPFVLEHCPQIFFAGNQAGFGSRLIDVPGEAKCLLVSVPKFRETREAVLVNLSTLEASTLRFSVDMLVE